MLLAMLGAIEIVILLGAVLWGLPRLAKFFRRERRDVWRYSAVAFVIGLGAGVTVLASAVYVLRSNVVVQSPAIVERHMPIVQPPVSRVSQEVHAELVPVAEDPSTESLPDWAKRETHVVHDGVVPTVLVVKKSGEWSTSEEARVEAMEIAKRDLLARMASKYSGIESWNMPTALFSEIAVKDKHLHARLHDFGKFKDTMSACYVQYMDSPEIREQVVEHWERFTVNRNVRNVSGVFGAAVVGLGALSILLRGASRMSARRARAEVA